METGPAILDTDTLSELSRGHPRVRERALSYLRAFGRLTTTAITVFERLRGYELALKQGKPFERQRQAFEGLIAACVVLPFDDEAAAIAARLWAVVERAQRNQLGDILIAAVAVSRQLPLVTRNREDFARLSTAAGVNLVLVDWTRNAPR
jgi:predicted nucleic acid-binding protein